MTKTEAVLLFDTAANLARSIGLSRSRISQWDEKLTQKQADMVIGAAVRLGKLKPGGSAQKPKAAA